MKIKIIVIIILIFTIFIRIKEYMYIYNEKYKSLLNKQQVFEVEVNSLYKEEEDSITYKVKYDGNYFLLSIKNKEYKYKNKDRLVVLGKMYEITKNNNPYEFDYKIYLNSNGIVNRIYSNKILKEEINTESLIFKIRTMFSNKLELSMSYTNSNILKSIMYGDDMFLDSNIEDKFMSIGIGHFICVSGSHIIFLLKSFEKITRTKKLIILKFILLIYFFCICLFNITLFRAICMFFLLSINKNYSYIKRYFISLYIVILINPYYIFNVGILLSFLSVLSIKLFYSLINSYIKVKFKVKGKIAEHIIDNISLTLSSQILILPILLYCFGYFSLMCIFSNLLLGVLLDYIMSFSFILFILFFIPYISNILIIIVNFLISLLVMLVDYINSINYINITFPIPPILIIIIYYILVLLFLYDKKLYVIFWKSRKTIRKIVKLFKILSLSSVFIWYIYISFFEKCIIFFNVNQGNMAYIRDGITNIIVDIGSTRENNAANIMINYLNGKNIKYIDAILITHIHSDHINGIEELLENIDVGWIIMSIPVEKSNDYLELVKLLKRRKIPIIYIKEEDKITIGNINIDILSPPNSKIIDDDILNANSTVYLIEWNYKYALFMGDATKNTEKYILNKYINDFSIKEKLEKISFYQVAHHGSKTSTFEPFISKINNCNAIISADKSVYGHPDESVVELLKKYYFNVYITEQNGAIKF